MESFLSSMPIWLVGAIFSLLAGLATAVGALVVFFVKKQKLKHQDAFLGFGAGIMLAATSFSLIIPGLKYAGGGVTAVFIIVAGMILGGVVIFFSDKFIPNGFFAHERDVSHINSMKRIWLFIIAITLHNFPEGLAVGVGFGTGDIINGITLAIGIGLQNIPEGLAVALSLSAIGYSRKKSFLVGGASGMVEPIGGLLGAGVVTIFSSLLPWGLAFAAGAMLFVIVGEIIPESHKAEDTRLVTLSVLLGFCIMLILDVLLG